VVIINFHGGKNQFFSSVQQKYPRWLRVPANALIGLAGIRGKTCF